MKIKIISFIFLIIAISLFSYTILKPQISANANLSAEKCTALNNDDCWHALAHQLDNKTICYLITDNEIREHCLEHIPN